MFIFSIDQSENINGFETHNEPVKETKPEKKPLEGYQLSNYPNPFTEGTIIDAYIPSDFINSEIIVYDMIGNKIIRYELQTGLIRLNSTA